MPDDVTLPGAGVVVATDDVAGRQFQRVKLDLGDDGASAPVTTALPVVASGYRGSVRASKVLVGLAAVLLPAVALAGRKTLVGRNLGTTTVWLGGSAVTVATGMPVLPRESITADISDAASLYAIADTAGQDVRVLEIA